MIPADVLVKTKTKILRKGHDSDSALLEGVTNDSRTMKIDSNAFITTKQHTQYFHLCNIYCQNELDLQLLSGFDKLETLEFGNVTNIHRCLPTLPFLPLLSKIRFVFPIDLKKLEKFPISPTSKRFTIKSKIIGDSAITRILDALLINSA